MPQLAGAVAAGWTWITGSTWGALAARAALQIGLAYAASQYAARKVDTDTRTSREVLVRSAIQPKTIVFGKCFVSGLIAYSNARPVPPTHDNYELFVQIVHAGHKCADIEEFVFDDVRVTAAQIDWGASASPIGFGHVSGGRYGILLDGPSNLWAVHVEKHLNGERSPMLEKAGFNGDITSAHQMTGNCTSVFRFVAAKNSEELYNSGPPTVIKVLVKGALVYDPRKDSTNGGSGSHRLATESTWEWSDNPILCGCYYMLKVMGVASTRIDWPSAITQADICDVLCIVPPSASPSHYEKRYTCNGQVTTGESDQNNLSAILSSCLGSLVLEGGKYKFRAGAYTTPDVSITVDDIIGNVGVTTAPPRADRYNTVTGNYFSSEDTAQQVDFVPVTDSSYLSRDNGVEIRKVIDLPMTNSEYMAQRIARKLLNQSDNMISVTLPMRWTGLQLAPNTYVTLTYPELSWSSKVFRVTGFTLSTSGEAPINVLMTEDSSGAWADPTIGQYAVRTAAGTIDPAVRDVPPVTGATVTGAYGFNYLTWVNPANAGWFDAINIYASDSSAWSGASLIWTGRATSHMHFTNAQQWYWITAVKGGVESDREPDSDTSTLTAMPGSPPLWPNLMPIGYADFERVNSFAFTASPTGTAVISSAQAWIGSKSLLITPTAGTGEFINVEFANNTAFRNIPMLPGRRHLVIFSIYLPTTDARGDVMSVKLEGGTHSESSYDGPSSWASIPTTTWTRICYEVLSPAVDILVSLTLHWEKTGATTTPAFYMDGLVLLDVENRPDLTADNYPQDFVPSGSATLPGIGFDAGGIITAGSGSPENVVTAPIGSLYLRTNGSTSTTLYVKTSGTGNTGWTAK